MTQTQQSIRQLLMRLGLDDREADVYLALLPLKIAKVSAVAKAARQPRTLAYVVLQNLEERGFVSRVKRGSVLHFVAEPPQRLVSFAAERKDEYAQVETLLEGALPFLSTLESPLVGEPRVTLLHGLDGMKQVYKDILQYEICGCGNAKTMYDTYGMSAPELAFGKDFAKFTMRGRDLFVDNEKGREFVQVNPPNPDYEVRFLPEGTSFIADSLIFGDTVALFAYDEDLSIVRIENKNLADYFRSWFEVLWSVSTRVDREGRRLGEFGEPQYLQ